MDTQTQHSQQLHCSRVSWAGVWAGLFVGLGTQIVLTSLGLGVELTSNHSSAAELIRNIPAGVEVWSGLAWLFSAFLGGYVAAWMSGSYSRADGVFHGFVTWGVLMAALLFSATTMMGLMFLKGLAAVPLTPLLRAASWWFFGSGIVSLGFAYMGGRIGVRAAQHSAEEKTMQRAA